MKEILSNLEAILQLGYSPYSVFNDWLDLMLFALQQDDESYLEIVKKYRNDRTVGKREIDYFANAFGALMLETQKTNDDVLGLLYMEWNQNNKYRGQFFTPKHIASLMAKCLQVLQGNILDPACGSGVMLVETIKTMTNEHLDSSVFYGQDIDLTCAKMCALNLLFFNVNGFVIWGDSLAGQCQKVFETKRSYLGGSIRELTGNNFDLFTQRYIGFLKDANNSNRSRNECEPNNNPLITNNNQLMLF